MCTLIGRPKSKYTYFDLGLPIPHFVKPVVVNSIVCSKGNGNNFELVDFSMSSQNLLHLYIPTVARLGGHSYSPTVASLGGHSYSPTVASLWGHSYSPTVASLWGHSYSPTVASLWGHSYSPNVVSLGLTSAAPNR